MLLVLRLVNDLRPRRPACRRTSRPAEAARRALPLAMFPVLAAGDLYAIYRWGQLCSSVSGGSCWDKNGHWVMGPPRVGTATPQSHPSTPLLPTHPCSELRSIHLRTLNKERAEIIAQHWLQEGRVPTPRQVRRGIPVDRVP